MAAIFSQILNMSMTGSVVILFVMVVRFLLKRSPKVFSYALWSVVLFRLLCPVSFTAPVSVLDVVEPKLKETSNNISMVSYIPVNVDTQADFIAVQPESVPVNQEEISEPEERLYMTPMHVAALVWAAGAAGMLLYSVGQYLHLRRKLIGAVLLNRNIYVADHIDTAFVVGLGNPRIYLPSCVPVKERFYILAHEQYHIRRFDHVIKLLAYFALCIHWFNPLVWIAFILAGKDMEMSCDEAVLKKLGIQIRADYSATLLRLATHRKILSGMPLAFGEGDTKGRILNMAKWKKPKLWVSVCGVILCLAVLAACAVNPVQEAETEADQASAAAFSDESINILCTLLSGEEESSVIVSVHPDLHTVTLGTILQDTYVSLPDYQGHRTEKNKFSACYTLGKAWGGTEGAEEMVNRCIQENFGITVDHNLELVDPDFTDFMDILNDVAGKLDAPLDQELQEISEQFLSLIAGSENSKKIRQVKEKLAEAKWESCTIPFEGTYIGAEVDIGGINTNVLMMEEPQNEWVSEEQKPTVSGSNIVTDIELLQYGSLNLALPSGIAAAEENGVIALVQDSTVVGGIALRHQQPDSPSTFSQEWQAEIGVPEASDETKAYMGGSSVYADYEITYFPDVPVNLDENGKIIPDEQGTYVLDHEVTHYFFVYGTDVYDLWFYINRIPNNMRETVLKSCFMEGVTDIAAMHSALYEEEEALQQCRAILEQIQSSDACKIETKQENGDFALNETTIRTDWVYGENRLHIDIIPESGGASMFGGLLVDGVSYECDSVQQWREITWWDWPDPWLTTFQWDASVVAYIDTLTEEGGTTVMLRIDQPFASGEDQQPHYFVNFNFDSDGSFRSVYLQTNVFMNNAISKTESILSLDSETVNAEIQKEYQKAIG